MRLPCEHCQSSDGVQKTGEFSFCHACKWVHNERRIFKPKDQVKLSSPQEVVKQLLLPSKAQDYLKQYYFNGRLMQYCFWSEALQRIGFEHDGNYWLRSLTEQPKWLYVGDPVKKARFIKTNDDDGIYIVEDIISGIRLSNNGLNVLVLGGTSLQDQTKFELLTRYKTIYIWLDGDAAGLESATKLRKKLKMYASIVVIITQKDPKCYTDFEITHITTQNKVIE